MSFLLPRQDSLDSADLPTLLHSQPRQAASLILKAAGQGLAEAQLLLGQILLDGRGIRQDRPLALHWFRIAARSGHGMAHNMLGRCLEHGWGCDADASAAAEHYRRAAQSGLDWGLYNLANLLATGRGVAADAAAAVTLYRRAAELGHAKSLNLLGRYYEEGEVVPRDQAFAHDCYRRSAEAGDFRGQFSHAGVLAEHNQIDAALDWLQQALAGGNLNFLRVARHSLQQSPHARLRELAGDYFARAASLGDASDQQALETYSRVTR